MYGLVFLFLMKQVKTNLKTATEEYTFSFTFYSFLENAGLLYIGFSGLLHLKQVLNCFLMFLDVVNSPHQSSFKSLFKNLNLKSNLRGSVDDFKYPD